MGDTCLTYLLTSLSMDSEYISITLSERRGCLLRASATLSSGEVLQEGHRGFSRLVFDHPPNPSIDHLVAVILEYPRREESGRRKCLNPVQQASAIRDRGDEPRRKHLLRTWVNKPLINAPNSFEWHHGRCQPIARA